MKKKEMVFKKSTLIRTRLEKIIEMKKQSFELLEEAKTILSKYNGKTLGMKTLEKLRNECKSKNFCIYLEKDYIQISPLKNGFNYISYSDMDRFFQFRSDDILINNKLNYNNNTNFIHVNKKIDINMNVLNFINDIECRVTAIVNDANILNDQMKTLSNIVNISFLNLKPTLNVNDLLSDILKNL
ncbi:MAG: hypothetical protein R3Y05_01220 [bacterium]